MNPDLIGRAGVVVTFGVGAYTAWTGFRPGADDSAKWYDRTIRIIGGSLIMGTITIAIIAFGIGRR